MLSLRSVVKLLLTLLELLRDTLQEVGSAILKKWEKIFFFSLKLLMFRDPVKKSELTNRFWQNTE